MLRRAFLKLILPASSLLLPLSFRKGSPNSVASWMQETAHSGILKSSLRWEILWNEQRIHLTSSNYDVYIDYSAGLSMTASNMKRL